MEGGNVAIYLDFENLAISAETVYPSQKKPLDVEPLVDYATTKGTIRIKCAYADWSKEIFAQYQPRLMEKGFELVHLPATNLQGKNGSDVRLAIDVMELLEQFPDIDQFIIGSGDTDFIPLIQRLRARGKRVVVLGFEHSVGNLVKLNSSEFKSLEELIGAPEEESPSSDLGKETDPSEAYDLMLRFLKSRDENGPILMARLKQQLLRLDPTFSEKEYGFSSFKQFVESMVGGLVEKVEMEEDTLPIVFINENGYLYQKSSVNLKENAKRFLNKKLRYQTDPDKRNQISHALFSSFDHGEAISMNQMFEEVHDQINPKLPKTDIKKYINTLFTGGAFQPLHKHLNGPLLSRPFMLKSEILHAEKIDELYIERVSEILQSRYTDLEAMEILELLI